MKRIIFTSLLMLLTSSFFFVSAGDTFISGFESGETGYTLNGGWYSGYTWEIVDNTETSGINNTDKCVMITTPSVPDRWGFWFLVKLTDPFTITQENRYFKVMVKRTPNTTNMALSITGESPWGANSYFGKAKPPKAGVWGDIVFDLFSDDPAKTCENKQIQEFRICLGTWDGTEAGICMLDNVALSDNSKPRGANEVASGLLVNFENETMTANNFASIETQSVQASAEIVNNPLPLSEVNPSEKALKYYKPANTTWWHALMCIPNGIIPVTYPNIYLHMMMYIPDATQAGVIIASPSGKSLNEKIYPVDGTDWYDYVIDVSEIDYINQIALRFNQTLEESWDNPAGDYFVDDFVLDANSEPREKIASGVKTTVYDNYKIAVNNGSVIVVSSELKSVSVYTVNGQILKQLTTAGSSLKFDLPKGTYILKIENREGKVSYNKVLI